MSNDNPIVFKTENSLWQMLADGSKTFDMRRWDLADDRIYRLSWFHEKPSWDAEGISSKAIEPQEKEVSFQNKATGEVLTFRYDGMEFTDWAPGWCFLILGERKEV